MHFYKHKEWWLHWKIHYTTLSYISVKHSSFRAGSVLNCVPSKQLCPQILTNSLTHLLRSARWLRLFEREEPQLEQPCKFVFESTYRKKNIIIIVTTGGSLCSPLLILYAPLTMHTVKMGSIFWSPLSKVKVSVTWDPILPTCACNTYDYSTHTGHVSNLHWWLSRDMWNQKIHSQIFSIHWCVHNIPNGLRHPVAIQVVVVLHKATKQIQELTWLDTRPR